jgi:hypothetical protein
MLAILKAADAKGYKMEVSIDKELPEKLLKTDEADFAVGYVFQACKEEVGTLVKGTSKFAKGQQAYQRSCVDYAYSSSRHLRKGGDKSLEERFSNMKSFTQSYWSVRTRILNLLKSLRKKRPEALITYLKSKQELEKLIHTQVIWHNRGVFRQEEITYLDSQYHLALEALSGFRDKLNNPTERLATHFEEEYSPVRKAVKDAENVVSSLLNRRSQILFIAKATKKKDVEYNAKPLLEKLAGINDHSRFSAFIPSTLPGIGLNDTNMDILRAVTHTNLPNAWRALEGDIVAQEVCASWNTFLTNIRETD